MGLRRGDLRLALAKVGAEFLAVDSVQAGPGDLVLCAREGNTARQILGKASDPFHSVVVGVVDEVTVPGPEPVHGAHRVEGRDV